MRTRYLRKSIEMALTIITTILFIVLAMVDDMSMSFIPYYLLGVGIVATNVYILTNYGKGIFNE